MSTEKTPSSCQIVSRCIASSAHGLSRTVSDRTLPVRLFWLLLFLVMTGLFFRNCVTFIRQLRDAHVSSSYEADSIDFEFPDLYFCFDSPFSGSRYLRAGAEVAAEVTARFAKVTSVLERWCPANGTAKLPPACASLPLLAPFLYTNSLPYDLAIDKLGRIAAQTVMEAKMAVGSGLRTTVIDLKLAEFFHPYHLRCFRLSLTDSQRTLLNTAGPFNGIFITLMMDTADERMAQPAQNASLPTITDVYGQRLRPPRWMLSPEVWFTSKNQPEVRVYIVSPGRYPNPFEANRLLEGVKFYTLQLDMQEEAYDVQQFGHRRCLPSHEDVNYLNPYDNSAYRFKYNREYCYYASLTKEFEQAANCSSGYMPQPWPRSSRKSVWNLTESEGFFSMPLALPNATSGTLLNDNSAFSDSAQCDRQTLCVQRRYLVTSASSVPWPPGGDTSIVLALVKQRLLTAPPGEQLPALEFANSLLTAAVNASNGGADAYSYVRQNWLRLRVTSQKSRANRISFSYAYSLDSFFGDIGGIMGMYLGMSLLTVCELIELLHDFVLACLRRRAAANRVDEGDTAAKCDTGTDEKPKSGFSACLSLCL